MKKLALLIFALLVFGSLAFARSETVSGVVSDSRCELKHATDGDAKCIEHCVHDGASYVLISSGRVYQLDGQDHFKGLAGKAVVVTGKIKESTIVVKRVVEKTS